MLINLSWNPVCLSFDLAAFLPVCHLLPSFCYSGTAPLTYRVCCYPAYLWLQLILIACLSIIPTMLSVSHPACLSIDLAVFLSVYHPSPSPSYNSLIDSTCVACLSSWCLSIVYLSVSLSLLPWLSIHLCVRLYVVQLVCLLAFLSTNKNYLTLLSLPWFTTNNLSIKNTFLKKK